MPQCVYANVVIDIQARELKDKLFTYEVPASLAKETFIGSQVLVPFGAKHLVGGCVVSLTNHRTSDKPLKAIVEILDPEPLFGCEYIEFLHWLAEYYCANIADVISAAIPAALSPRFKRLVKLNPRQRAIANGGTTDVAAEHILATLEATKLKTLSMLALKQRWRATCRLPQTSFYRALNHLRQDGLLEIQNEAGPAQAPKVVPTVSWTGQEAANPRHERIVQILARHNGQMIMKDLIAEARTTSATIKKLSNEGLLSLTEQEVLRDPLAHLSHLDPAHGTLRSVELTTDQAAALSILKDELKQIIAGTKTPEHPWLLHGVTGSGKTEVYLRLIQETLNQGRTALMLVPEISLTPQLSRRLKERFGHKVSIWHSALTNGEKYDTWRRLRSGDVRVLLGARSAVLAHLPDLGLIVLDEEHDGSYKQSSPSPRYHAKDVALEQARRHKALLLLGSATPDVCSYFQASQHNKILELPDRVFKQDMPSVQIVDMREEFQYGNRSIFSTTLAAKLSECLNKEEQAILLINRRGYASHVFCRACGYVVKCRHCSVALVFHQPILQSSLLRSNLAPDQTINHNPEKTRDHRTQHNQAGYLSCHHCGYRIESTDTCPACQSPFIRQYGLGTQRVEEEVRQHYPKARLLRLDSDTAAKRGAHEQVLRQFADGHADILIGTQMVSKGLDIPKVTLVGVLAADAAFNLPDYRSIERGFQLLTQVSGRAGRGSLAGAVILQTYDTEMPALDWARSHNYKTFVEEELLARKSFDYPPFSQLLRVVVSGPEILAVEAACDRLAEEIGRLLEDCLPEASIKVLGPAPCLIERLRGKYRYHLLIKNLAGDRGRTLITSFLRNKYLAPDISLSVDVDPLDLL